MRVRRAALAGLALTLAAGAGATERPAPPPPPYAGAYQPHGVDEIGLWHEDDESERLLAQAPLLVHDEALNAYVKGILCATVGADRCAAVRLYILRTPAVNASMTPQRHDARLHRIAAPDAQRGAAGCGAGP